MPVWNLPPLASGFGDPGASGNLVAIPELETLALNLEIPKGPLTQAAIRSVPDPWAQVLVSTEVLANQGPAGAATDPLLADIEARWRALLATIALQNMYAGAYRLSLEKLSAEGGHLRSLLLGKLKPQSRLADDADWASQVSIIKLARMVNGSPQAPVPIGLAVPDIIVAPGRNFGALKIPELPWLRSGPVDPLKAGLSADALATIGDFVKGLAEAARGLKATDQPAQVQKGIVGALESYADAAHTAAVGPLRRQPVASGLSWPGPVAGALGALSGIVDTAGTSDCRLELRSDIERKPFASIMLADPAIATAARPASSIRLFGTYMLSDAEHMLGTIKEAAEKQGHLVLSLDDLLTRRLAKLRNGRATTHAGAAAGYLLPLTPAALLIASGETLAANAILDEKGGHTTAGIRVRIAGMGDHLLTRDYASKDVDTVDRLDDLGLWPDFRSEGWQHHSVRAQFRTKSELSLLVPASGALLVADLGEQPFHRLRESWIPSGVLKIASDAPFQSLGKGAATLQQFPFPSTTGSKQTADLIGLQSWSTRAPEALFMGYSGRPVGCIVPKLSAIIPDANREATVAIDFGTSNTIVRADIDGQQQTDEKLEPRVIHPIDPLPGTDTYETADRISFQDFFPIDGSAMPFPTILKSRHQLTPVAADVRGVAQWIFFAPPGLATQIVTLVQQGALKSNIKWDTSSTGTDLTRQFLSQLMLMVSAELAARRVKPDKINWRFSFPNAFDDKTTSSFLTTMEGAIGGVTGAPPPRNRIGVYSEAKAAMQSLVVNAGANALSNLVILLDIGGGTTDIAVWHGHDTIWQQSFRLAAREFFTAPLARRPELLESSLGALDDATRRQLTEWQSAAPGSAEEEHARALCELLINRDDFSAKFTAAAALGGRPAWKELELAATLALGGILWFVGRQFRASRDAWKASDAEFANVTVVLGGNGATYFKLIDPRNSAQLKGLAQMIARGAGVAADPTIRFSEKPKREVVDGLVTLPPGDAAITAAHDSTILGLKISESGTGHGADEPLEQFPADLSNVQIDLAEMEAFLADYKQLCGFDVSLTRAGKTANAGTLEAQLKSTVRQALQKGDFSHPPFINALRRLVSELS